jgi:hypothetical protein
MTEHSPGPLGRTVRRWGRRTGALGIVALTGSGALGREGWFQSFRSSKAVDAAGRPLPWYTYACIGFLERRLLPAMRVFEFGAGMSTLWYAARVGEVVSVEDDPEWAAEVRHAAPASVTLVERTDADDYAMAITGHGAFDVVAIDGNYRVECLRTTLEAVTPRSVIVWDNSDREEFEEARRVAGARGFRVIEFRGMGPVNRIVSETSILYRPENVFGI